MATPASRFRPSKADAAASLQGSGQLPPAIPRQSAAPKIEQPTDPARRPTSAGAVEFDVVVPPCGHFALSHGGQDIWIGPAFAGKTVTLWADDRSIHITMEGHLLKTMASRTSLEQLHQLRDKRQTRPAGPPPAAPALPRHRGRVHLPPGMAVEVERTANRDGIVVLAQQDIKLPVTLAGSRVILRMDEHVLHAISNDRVVRTMPMPIPADQRGRLMGVRQASSPLPPSGPAGPLLVQRRVNIDGFLMVAKQRMRVGPTHVGKIVNVIVEDTHFRIVHDGEELAVHSRTTDRPVSRFKAWASAATRPDASKKS
ncbi:Mu transposase domain-containing protein [Streptomyces sp. NPDC003032]